MTTQGIARPFKFGHTGGLERTEGNDKLKQNLKSIVETTKLERVFRPDLGSVAIRQVFRNSPTAGAAILKRVVREAIVQYEKRVRVEDISVQPVEDRDGMKVYVRVGYTVIGTAGETGTLTSILEVA